MKTSCTALSRRVSHFLLCFEWFIIEYRSNLNPLLLWASQTNLCIPGLNLKSVLWCDVKKTHISSSVILLVLFALFASVCHFLSRKEQNLHLPCSVYFRTVMTTVITMKMMMVMVQVQVIPVNHPRLYTDCTLSGYFGRLWVMASVVSPNIIGCWSCPSGEHSAHRIV